MKISLKLLMLLLVLTPLGFLFGCGAENVNLVTAITASSTRVVVGKTATVSCTLTKSGATTSSTNYTYSWSATGGSFVSSIGSSVTWNAPTTVGIYSVKVSVSGDDGTTGTASINISVVSGTQETGAPVIKSLNASPVTGAPGFTSTLSCDASSPSTSTTETTTLSYTWSATGGTLSSNTGKVVSWTAPSTIPLVPTTYTMTVTVSDGTLSTVGTVNLLVTNGSSTSVIQITGFTYATPVYASTPVALTVTATDSQGYAMTYLWSTNDGSLASHTGTTVTWNPPSMEGTYPIFISITDTANNNTTQQLNVLVNASIEAPVIDSVVPTTTEVLVNTSVTVNCLAHDTNSPPRTLTYSWSATGGVFTPLSGTTVSSNFLAGTTPGYYSQQVMVSNGSYFAVMPFNLHVY